MKRLGIALKHIMGLAILLLLPSSHCTADSADVVLPSFVSFTVTNVSLPSIGSPNPTTASFANATLAPGFALRVSLMANSIRFTRPVETGDYIRASQVSWTTTGASNGTGYAGTLTGFAYTRVYQSNVDAASGSVNVTWTLAAPGSSVRAGAHTLVSTWKVESL